MKLLPLVVLSAVTALACQEFSSRSLLPFPAEKELGMVRWSRDLEESLATAKQTGKPALVLFQEVPG